MREQDDRLIGGRGKRQQTTADDQTTRQPDGDLGPRIPRLGSISVSSAVVGCGLRAGWCESCLPSGWEEEDVSPQQPLLMCSRRKRGMGETSLAVIQMLFGATKQRRHGSGACGW